MLSIWHFMIHFKQRLLKDQINICAGHLSFVTLLSLVPMMAVSMSILSSFPGLNVLRERVESFIFNHLLPSSGENIQAYINDFTNNATRDAAFGIVVLIVVALLLIFSIDKALNNIWRTKDKRSILVSFPMYWIVLTLGPVLMGASLVATSYMVSIKLFGANLSDVIPLQIERLPLFFSMAAFFLIYMVVPNSKVKFFPCFIRCVCCSTPV